MTEEDKERIVTEIAKEYRRKKDRQNLAWELQRRAFARIIESDRSCTGREVAMLIDDWIEEQK